MYIVKYGSQYLHDPRDEKCLLADLSLECEENSCGYCDFTIYPNHPMYNEIKERDTRNPVEVYEDDILLFAGFIYEIGKEFYLDGHVKCKGELEYLRESIVRPYTTLETSYYQKAPESLTGYFNWLIEQHNSQVEESKQFVVGINEGYILDSGYYTERENYQYPKTLDELYDKLINNDNAGGYIRIRHENGIRYIDYLADWDNTNSQILDFGVNLTSYTQTDDSQDIATFLVPSGAKISETNYEYDNGYRITEDNVRDRAKTYYTLTSNYSYVGYITEFEEGVTYYEKITSGGSEQSGNSKYFRTQDTTPNPTKRYFCVHTTSNVTDQYIEANATYGYVSSFQSGYTYYEKGSSGGSSEVTTESYIVTTDTTPGARKLYYRLSTYYSTYSDEHLDFENGVNYYEHFTKYDESNTRISIKGVFEGQYYENYDYYVEGDMIYCKSAVDTYGWIGSTYSNTEITNKEDLIIYGILALTDIVSPKRTIEIKAIDMHFLNPDLKPIMVGEYVRVRSKPHNLDSFFLCRSIDLDLNNPSNSSYILGDTYDMKTGRQDNKVKVLNSMIKSNYDKEG